MDYMMKKEHISTSLFFLITAIFFFLFYKIFVPFFAPICWAAVFAIIFYPLYEKILKRLKSKGWSSFIICMLIIILIIGPIAYLLATLASEAITGASKINSLIKSGELKEYISIDLPWLDSFKEKLQDYYDFSKLNLDAIAKQAVENITGLIISQSTWLITNMTRMVFYFILMIFSMYYFFKDGELVIDNVKRLIPLTAIQINVTFKQLREVIQATMYGGLVVAMIQGLLGGILFAIIGIPSAVFWGAIMAFLSIIPFVGAFVIYIPAGLILMLSGSFVKGLIVIIIGSIVISQIDNLLRPYLISGRTSLHPLLLFFAILGGIYLYGLLGIVLGPLIAAVFIILLKIIEFKLNPETETGLT